VFAVVVAPGEKCDAAAGTTATGSRPTGAIRAADGKPEADAGRFVAAGDAGTVTRPGTSTVAEGRRPAADGTKAAAESGSVIAAAGIRSTARAVSASA